MEGLESLIKVSEFAKELARRKLTQEYSVLGQATFLEWHQKRLNRDPAVESLNRYTDILPCKDRLNHGLAS